MLASRIAAVSLGPRSQLLDGLTPTDRKTIVAAATPRQFFANSVITNQGHPADHLFLLTKGLVRYFFVTEEGKKLLFHWLGAGDLFGGRAILRSSSASVGNSKPARLQKFSKRFSNSCSCTRCVVVIFFSSNSTLTLDFEGHLPHKECRAGQGNRLRSSLAPDKCS